MRVVPSAAYTYEVCGFGGVRRLAGSALYASVADFVASPSSAATGDAAAAGAGGVLVAGHRVEEGTDRPHGPVGGRDAGEVRERAADPGQDGGLPAPVAQVRHQRPALCGRVVGLPGGPDLSIVDGHGVEQ